MSATFVFFHVGPDFQQPTMMVHSLREANPSATIIQCTDDATPPIQNVHRVVRSAGNSANLMTYRISAFAELNLTHPALYLDTDMLALQPIDPAALLGGLEVMLCQRQFDTQSPHSGAQRGVQFPEHRGIPLGVVYPYVACATITRNFEFWKELQSIIDRLDERFHRWYGDQEAMRLWAEERGSRGLGCRCVHASCAPAAGVRRGSPPRRPSGWPVARRR